VTNSVAIVASKANLKLTFFTEPRWLYNAPLRGK
jgi:hypothetical protein